MNLILEDGRLARIRFAHEYERTVKTYNIGGDTYVKVNKKMQPSEVTAIPVMTEVALLVFNPNTNAAEVLAYGIVRKFVKDTPNKNIAREEALKIMTADLSIENARRVWERYYNRRLMNPNETSVSIPEPVLVQQALEAGAAE